MATDKRSLTLLIAYHTARREFVIVAHLRSLVVAS